MSRVCRLVSLRLGCGSQFFDELPFMLRHECVWHMVSKALNGIPMFAGLDATIQVGLAPESCILNPKSYAALKTQL